LVSKKVPKHQFITIFLNEGGGIMEKVIGFVRVSLKVSTDSQEKCFHYIAN